MYRRTLLSALALSAMAGISTPLVARAQPQSKGDIGKGDPNVPPAGPHTLFKTAIASPSLKYDVAALAPVISASTVGVHHGKHHVGYYNTLKGLLSPADLASLSLEDVILRNAPERQGGEAGKLFNNAAQVWNHNFYWDSLRAKGGGKPGQTMAKAIDASFGSFDAFKEKFTAASVAQFGSGWAWLVKDRRSGQLGVVTTSNAATPLTDPNLVPLLVVDVWEHAYYLDYQNKRADYVKAVFDKLLDWGFAEKNLAL